MQQDLDLVASIAAGLMEVTTATVAQVSEDALAKVVQHFNVDSGFLRHNNHTLRISTLIAQWPPQPGDPDPHAVVYFSTADPVLSHCVHGTALAVIPQGTAGTGPRGIKRRRGESSSVAAAPLISGDITTGMLGFVRSDRKDWKPEQLNLITAIASLFAQLQGRIAAEEKLHNLAERDDLTGLHNRRALVKYLKDRLADGRPAPVAVLYLDADRLKSVNDFFGHTVGDWYIQVLAQRLTANLADVGMVARLGGDEFVVVPNEPMQAGEAEALGRRICTMLSDRLKIGGDVITPTVSIGVATGEPGRDKDSDLIHRADEAVLAAKRLGGNQVVTATNDMSLRSDFRNDIELHLQDDIDSEALRLHYLPEVDLWTGAIVATEALVRWQHPTRGLLLPDSFIGVAESTNLAGELGRWVLRKACAEFSDWRSRGVGHATMLRINVSPVQLVTASFVETVADTIAEFGIDSGSICLEITERAVVHDIDATRKALEELKEVGVKIAVDDFGTGYAVLSHLKDLPIDILKIDTTFVRDLGANPGDLAIVRAIIGLADAFGLQVVAEGVETPIAALTLMQHGCHRAQGFLLSRPIPGDAMEALLSARWMPLPFLADRDSLGADEMPRRPRHAAEFSY